MEPELATRTNKDPDPHSECGSGFINSSQYLSDLHSGYGSGFSNPNQCGSTSEYGSGFINSSQYGSGPAFRIRIRTRNLENKGKDCIFTNQRSTLKKLTVQCSYIIGSQKLKTPADQDNCFNCLSFTNNERRNADKKGITDGCCLVECSRTAPKKKNFVCNCMQTCLQLCPCATLKAGVMNK